MPPLPPRPRALRARWGSIAPSARALSLPLVVAATLPPLQIQTPLSRAATDQSLLTRCAYHLPGPSQCLIAALTGMLLSFWSLASPSSRSVASSPHLRKSSSRPAFSSSLLYYRRVCFDATMDHGDGGVVLLFARLFLPLHDEEFFLLDRASCAT
jgi:hypothetical protein